jgi:isoleucyl-tRNA synthetase
VLTNWYVRRSRDRFWSGDTESVDGRAAFDTLYTVLETVNRVAAPLIPLVGEEVWRGLTGGRSVHLEDWPDADAFPQDDALVAAMDLVREVASAGLGLRKAKSLRVRLPLATLTVVAQNHAALADYAEILQDELNVKKVVFEAYTAGSLATHGIEQVLTVNARALGPRLGKRVQEIIGEAKKGNWTANPVAVAGEPLLEGEYTLVPTAADPASAVAFLSDGSFVILDTELTPELEAEGLARDVIRVVQDTRKAAGLEVSDRIELSIFGADSADVDAISAHVATIAAETLATEHSVSLLAQSVDSTAGAQRATIEAGQYANRGLLLVDVRKAGPVNV